MLYLKRFKEYSIYLVPLIVFLLVGAFIPHFLDIDNLLNVMRQSSIIAIGAVAMTMVIITTGIDLSIGGLISLCAMVSGMLMLKGVNIFIAMSAGILVGVAWGLFTGFMISKIEIPAFIATLVIGSITQGIALILGNGRSIGGFPEGYVFLGNGTLLGIPISNYIMVVFVIVGIIILNKTSMGNHIYALGGNESVVQQEGISTNKIKLFVYGFSGFCAASAGLLLSAQMDTVHPIQGDVYILNTVAACAIGGVSMMGGVGNIAFSLIGALVIGFLRNALNLLRIHPFYQNIIVGLIIIVVVALNIYNNNKKLEANKRF